MPSAVLCSIFSPNRHPWSDLNDSKTYLAQNFEASLNLAFFLNSRVAMCAQYRHFRRAIKIVTVHFHFFYLYTNTLQAHITSIREK